MNINVIKFFEKYDADPELQKRVQDAVNAYPGSLELREALVEACLLPFAEELGLPSLAMTVTQVCARLYRR